MNDMTKVNDFSLRYTGHNYIGSEAGTPIEIISKMLEEEISDMCPYFGMYEVMEVTNAFAGAWLHNSEMYNKSSVLTTLVNTFIEQLDGRAFNLILIEMPRLVDLYRRVSPRILGEDARDEFIRSELNSWSLKVNDEDAVIQRIGYLVDELSPINVYETDFKHVVHILLEMDTLSKVERGAIAVHGESIADMVHYIKAVYLRGDE